MKNIKRTIVERKKDLVNTLSLPRDLLLGASIVTMIGELEVTIENYKGILDYCDEYILIQGKTKQIYIQGKKLSIEHYTNEDMKVTGTIKSVTYLE